MKAKDLMIGDWYAFQGHPYKCTSSDIESLAQCEEKGAPTDISEIPLTPEILEKNGFKRENGPSSRWCHAKMERMIISLYRSNTFYSIMINTDNYLPILNNVQLHFVHQLQHCLKIVGIDKEIEL